MAVPKKRFRKIEIDGKKYHWKFHKKIIVVDETGNSLLIEDFGWYDAWLYLDDKESAPPDFKPKIVTPQFVRESVVFAISEGWKAEKMEIEYKKGCLKRSQGNLIKIYVSS